MTNLFMNHNCIVIISILAAVLNFVYGLSMANNTSGYRGDADSVPAAGTLLIVLTSIGDGIEECRACVPSCGYVRCVREHLTKRGETGEGHWKPQSGS